MTICLFLMNAINRQSQLSLCRATTWVTPWEESATRVAIGGLYAPTIRHHHRVTYIICTNFIRFCFQQIWPRA